ncbi:MAG TPA: LamG-like jellyroll fold domain-containing protein [Solirubrobacterales bacterium]|nr:LamG-like jellyroll fold domain-containing protein [Solirubrobacterales bacterium]
MALAALAAAWAPAAQAQPLQTGFTESVVFSGMTEPTDVAFASDGRVFMAEKSGLIKVFPNLTSTTPTVAADLRTQVYNFWDRGLLSIALDPQFPTRPYLYAIYSYDAEVGGTAPRWGKPNVTDDPCPTPPGATDEGCMITSRLTKLTLSGSVVTSEQPLITDWCQQFPSHSAGGLVFGPDGMLYASGGDGASFNFTDYGQEKNKCGDPPGSIGTNLSPPGAEGGALRSQDVITPGDPTSLDGTVIRVDPDTGVAAPGNPLSASPDGNSRRIVANGMRNPFRFTFRPGTSEIYVGDVGWGTWEEINRLPNPTDTTVDNFGWPCYEGVARSPAYEGAGLNLCKQLYNTAGSVTSPLFTYEHGKDVISGEDCTAGGSSISGLAFYQGGNYPAKYADALFFADYSRRCTWVMFKNATTGLPDPSTRIGFTNENDPVNIKIGPGGDLFIVDFTGQLRRISFPGGNRAPTAVASAQPQFGPLPLTVDFDGSTSSDPDAGDTITYAWDLDGDGQFDDSTAAKPKWTYTKAETVTVKLKVTDKGALSATATLTIGAGNEPPDAQIETPTEGLHWVVGEEITFKGKGVDPQEGTLAAAKMSWTLIMRHCETLDDCHSHTIKSFPGVSEEKFIAPDHEFPSHLELRLTVTDSSGLSNTEALRLDPKTVDLTFATSPPGLNLTVGQDSVTTPATETVIVGSKNSVTAQTPQALGGQRYGFDSWSDGGANSHQIVAPASPTTYTATYKPEPSPPGLVLGYGFEETSGTTATDTSTAKNNGTLNGATGTPSGKFGRALSFDGTNDRVDVPDANSLDLTNGMTLEAWVKPTTNGGYRTALMKERGADLVYSLYASNGATPKFESFTTGENAATSPNGLSLTSWTHLTATYDGTTMRLYENGTQVATKATTGSMPNTTGALRIGGNAPWGEYFSGLIDEVRVYNRALSVSEIEADMNIPVGSPAAPDSEAPSAPGSLKATGSLGKVTLGWDASTDNVGVTGYEVYRSTTPGFTPALPNRIATPGGTGYVDTTAAGTYYYRVKAIDAKGNLSNASEEASGTATADTNAPTGVAVTAPAPGTVSGTLTLKASASDDVGVAGVQFLIDGNNFGAEDTGAPYEIPWPSTGVANGTHKISARARDAANNTTTSSEVSVTVDNAPATGLVLALGFDETSGATAADASPAKNNGAISGATSNAGGKFGRALSFDGVNDKVDVLDANSLDLTTGMTLEAWVKPTTNSGWRTALMKERGANLLYALYASNGVAPNAENFTAAENAVNAPAVNALPLNAWTHIASTYDGTSLKLFVNGTQVGTKAATGAMPNTTGALRIGGNAPWGEYFSGLIDEVRVYNRALTATEIGTDMLTAIGPPPPQDTEAPSAPGNLKATGSLGKVTLGWDASTDNVGVTGYEVYRSTTPGFTPALANRIATPGGTGYVDTTAAGTYYYRVKAADAIGNLSLASGEASGTATADTNAPTGVAVTAPAAGTVSGTVTLKASASDDVGVAGVQFLIDGNNFGAEDTGAPYEIPWPSTGVANGAHKISARARDAANNTTTSADVSVTVNNAPATGLVLALGFNETSGVTATDASPSKNNGTVSGATSVAGGKIGRALSFDGVNDKVDVPDAASLDLTTGMTLEAWVNPTTKTGYRTALMKERNKDLVYALYASNGSTPKLENFTATENAATAPAANSLPLNTWSHLAATYDGTTLRLYVNGTQVATKAATGAMPNTANPLRIGGNSVWGEYFSGLVDEVRVYNRALTAGEIATDMTTAIAP